jgi:hypothetical protein
MISISGITSDPADLTVVSSDGTYFGASSAYLVDLTSATRYKVDEFHEGTDSERRDFAHSHGVRLLDILSGEEAPFVSQAVLYKFDGESFFDEDEAHPGYTYALPSFTGRFWVCDCWIVNERGEKHPDYDAAPVPLTTCNLEPVGDNPWIANVLNQD